MSSSVKLIEQHYRSLKHAFKNITPTELYVYWITTGFLLAPISFHTVAPIKFERQCEYPV
ncbi:hypothetical protein PHLGIDRAFT_143036 [Phlebiopsis gigantea 11061_1 CR5-6]|uniref:Uncharacterized protein n=1 Tax=Phlebiopsis gigantea (strain 11061_1 CR5-6) TaxID=745531 RepID=A0A0C3S5N1_PHLG1|nr:hypothetical protein PHLGIDRAFT_143036 [Phlebiopsis gigantea 11061_1 CR5-6]